VDFEVGRSKSVVAAAEAAAGQAPRTSVVVHDLRELEGRDGSADSVGSPPSESALESPFAAAHVWSGSRLKGAILVMVTLAG
jgi:hypothetical protein